MKAMIGGFLDLLGRNSIEAGALVLVVLTAQWVFGKQMAPRWRCALWLLVMARLLLPISAGSVVSLFNLFPHWENAPPAAGSGLVSGASGAKSSQATRMPEPTSDGDVPMPPDAGRPPNSLADGATSKWPANIKTETEPVGPSRGFKNIFWPPVLCGVWAAGAFSFGGCVLFSSLRIRRRLAALKPITDARILALLRDCCERLELRRGPSLAESPDIGTPSLYGFLQPRLLLPGGFAARFSEKELRFILLHELAHVKRRDIFFNWLAAVLQIIHWFNPLIWLGFARWRADRELACDALALETAGAGQNQEYGRTILRLLDNFRQRRAVPGLVGILEDRQELQRRMRMIAGFRPGRKLGVVSVILFAGIGLACLTDAQNKTSTAVERAVPLAQTRLISPIQPAPRMEVTDGRSMKVTVLDATTGEPLENAEVFAPNEASFFGRQENAPRWLTDKSGVAMIRLGEPLANSVEQTTWFTLSARKERYGPAGMSWSDGSKDVRPGLPKEVTLRLKPGVSVGGVVVDETGAVQAGIQVKVFGCGYSYGNGQQTQSYPEFWNDSASSVLPVTDATGQWQATDFPADLANVAIQFIRPDGSVEKFRYPPVAVNMNEPQGAPLDLAALLAGNARFVLKTGHALHGLVVNSQGQALPGVLIKTGYGVGNLETAGEVRADATGHFELYHLNHPQVILTGEAPSCAITSLIVDLPAKRPEIRFEMGELSPLRIHVKKGEEAIAGAIVSTAVYGTEGQVLDFTGVTDAQGNLTWTNAPVATFSLVAAASTSGWHQKIRVLPEQREVTFHLRAGLDKGIVIKATVRDARTGALIKVESVKFQTGNRETFHEAGEISDAGFHLALPAAKFLPGMYPSFQLQIQAPGYATLTTRWRDFDEGDWDANFVMKSKSSTDETVLLPDGSPAAGARLWTRTEDFDGALFMNAPDSYDSYRLVKGLADSQGKFVLPDVPADQPVIFSHADGFLCTSVAEVKGNSSVRLEPWGGVTGSLKVGGEPKGGVTINLAILQWFPKMGFNLIYSTTTRADGRFTFTKVPAGEYKLYRYSEGRIGRAITEDHQMPLTVKAGETTEIDYRNAGRAVIGRAMPAKPEPAVDWKNDDDTLTLKQPSLGAKSISPKDYATAKAFQKAYNDTYLAPGRLAQLRAAMTCVLHFEHDGSFRADDVPPGTYELNIKVTTSDPNAQFNTPEEVLGSITRDVVVPPGDTPFDLGTLVLAMKDGGKE